MKISALPWPRAWPPTARNSLRRRWQSPPPWETSLPAPSAGAASGASLVVMSKGTPYTQQSYKVSDSFPFKWINKKWKEGFYVTSMATSHTRWAVVMSRNAGFVDQCVDEKMADPDRIRHSRKVEFIAEPEITAMGLRYYVRVEIFLKDGTHMEETVEAQRGSETKFASQELVVDKFMKLGKHVFPMPQVEAIRDTILDLEKLDDAAKLAKLLVRA